MTTTPDAESLSHSPAAATVDWQQYPALAGARVRSLAILANLRTALANLPEAFPEVATVAVSGSLGRLEAGPHSDADLIVIVALQTRVSTERAAALMAHLWDALAVVGLSRPKPTGVFATPATVADLCSTTSLGRVAEDLPTFGKRMQLLLDARPVFDSADFAALQDGVVRRFAAGSLDRDPCGVWAYLLNDLIRYFRSLRVSDPWNFSTSKGGWYVRAAKLEHSRVLLYAGLLMLLGHGSTAEVDPIRWLLQRLAMTPIERIARVFVDNGDPYFPRIAATYERFLAVVNDPTRRALLCANLPTGPADLQGTAPDAFAELQEHARQLKRDLVRFVLARQSAWGAPFFESLLF